MMKPLEEWVCDTCGKTIEEVDQGWVEWLSNDAGYAADFRICHKSASSPLPGSCQRHLENPGIQDLSLDDFVGPKGLVTMLSFVDPGATFEPEYPGHRVRDLREWTELFRRLHLPYYEEARLHWDAAVDDGYFSGANEVWMYLPETLKDLIEEYESADDDS